MNNPEEYFNQLVSQDFGKNLTSLLRTEIEQYKRQSSRSYPLGSRDIHASNMMGVSPWDLEKGLKPLSGYQGSEVHILYKRLSKAIRDWSCG